MIRSDDFHTLRVVRLIEHGAILTDGDETEILLPKKYLSLDTVEGDDLDVFMYRDTEDRRIATTETPLAIAGDFAVLRVVDRTDIGYFLDRGLVKQLLLPKAETLAALKVGDMVGVYIYVDNLTDRAVATCKYKKYLSKLPPEYNFADPVSGLVMEEDEDGYTVAVDNAYAGRLYKNENFRLLKPGDSMECYVKTIRPDGKIDLLYKKPGYAGVGDEANVLLSALENAGGRLNLTDKSDPEKIKTVLGMSKKTFKQALGNLYKQRKVLIDDTGISLAAKS